MMRRGKDGTLHRHQSKCRQKGEWETASVPVDSDASIVANRPWKPANSSDIPLLRSCPNQVGRPSLEKKTSLLSIL